MEDDVRKNPANFQAAFNLAGAYLQMQQTNRAVQVLDGVLNSSPGRRQRLPRPAPGLHQLRQPPGCRRRDKLEARCANPQAAMASRRVPPLQKPAASDLDRQ